MRAFTLTHVSLIAHAGLKTAGCAARILTLGYPVNILPVGGEGAVEYVLHREVAYALYAESGAGIGSRGEYADEDGERNERREGDDKPFQGSRSFLQGGGLYRTGVGTVRYGRTYFAATTSTDDQVALLLNDAGGARATLLKQDV